MIYVVCPDLDGGVTATDGLKDCGIDLIVLVLNTMNCDIHQTSTIQLNR